MGIERLSFEDIGKVNRATLGTDIPLSVFRLVRLTGMNKILGESAGPTLYMVGKDIGIGLDLTTVDDLAGLVQRLRIGIPKVLKSSDDMIVIRVLECMTCSGLPDIGEMFCNFEGGLITGALEKILKRPAKAVQTKSQSAGCDCCEFEVSLF